MSNLQTYSSTALTKVNEYDVQRQKEELLQLVTFNIGHEEFGVDILKVQEIIRTVQITKVPNAPHFVDGVINLRGKVIPIVNLRVKLSMGKKNIDKDTRIIVIDLSGKIIGFVVDSVSEVIRIDSSITEPPPPMISSFHTDYITCVAKLENRLLILLDLNKVFSAEEQDVLQSL